MFLSTRREKFKWFRKKTSQHFNKELPKIRKYCLEEWVKAITLANEIQQSEGQICAYMSLSILNTSIIDDKPVLQVDFYNEEWVFGESWARYRMSADFLFNGWREFKFAALDKMTFLFTCYVKYFA